ncbi:MAG: EF-P lysine aminoacylase GenX [Lentisphaerae bacterium]|nr:EF-P lysine aminoacylase GenX [Lentisphaerota bacterium]
MLQPYIKTRSKLLGAIRHFFEERDFLEVETPVRIPVPAIELHIDAESSGEMYLRTSPELHMKRLLADGAERIFQMGPCFRRGEKGMLHNPEYTMLEWYRVNADYTDMILDTKALIAAILKEVSGKTSFVFHGTEVQTMPVWECMSISDVFMQHAGWNPCLNFDPDRFDVDLVEKIEPSLPKDRPVILKDYPAELAALAKLKDGCPNIAERWELYICGIELANAFTELVDPVEQRNRFEHCLSQRALLGKDQYEIDERFIEALEKGIPPCGGVALGVDRLLMLMMDLFSVSEVRML